METLLIFNELIRLEFINIHFMIESSTCCISLTATPFKRNHATVNLLLVDCF